MEWISGDLVGLIFKLIPGFLAAWVFHVLTAHPRLDAFERTIQALVFTAVIQAITKLWEEVLFWAGRFYSCGTWTENSGLAWSLFFGLAIGTSTAWLANSDRLHSLLRNLKVTRKTSYPSEWYAAFCKNERWIVLHLTGDRRLHGWPLEWPNQPDCGHFILTNPSWLLADGEPAKLHNVEQMVIAVSDVEMVELLKHDFEASTDTDGVLDAQSRLVKLQLKECGDE